jgi:hypothetical protein
VNTPVPVTLAGGPGATRRPNVRQNRVAAPDGLLSVAFVSSPAAGDDQRNEGATNSEVAPGARPDAERVPVSHTLDALAQAWDSFELDNGKPNGCIPGERRCFLRRLRERLESGRRARRSS